jgi:hypothetical protein
MWKEGRKEVEIGRKEERKLRVEGRKEVESGRKEGRKEGSVKCGSRVRCI